MFWKITVPSFCSQAVKVTPLLLLDPEAEDSMILWNNVNYSTQHNNPEDYNLQQHC